MNSLIKKTPVHKSASHRALAIKILTSVIIKGRSLTDALSYHLAVARPENAFAKQLCFGTLRFYERLNWQLTQLLSKPLKEDQQTVRLVLILGLYQVQFSHVPAHACVSETVELVREIDQEWAVALVNGVLRNFLREQKTLDARMHYVEVARYSHPLWLIKALKNSYPEKWLAILEAGLCQAPLTVRVNVKKLTREVYLQKLNELGIAAAATRHSPAGVRFAKGLSAVKIPGFLEGEISVQDEAAQLAAWILELAPGQRVLDACAAPGGKSCHLLETADIHLTALEIDAQRCLLIAQNLQRLQLTASIVHADASDLNAWWDQQLFDRILLDAPCSATGIIRRQPDIKLHRHVADVKQLMMMQTTLLATLWQTLKPGGILVYATCSILPSENSAIIQAFLKTHGNAELKPIGVKHLAADKDSGIVAILPGFDDMDGFFYAKLQKNL